MQRGGNARKEGGGAGPEQCAQRGGAARRAERRGQRAHRRRQHTQSLEEGTYDKGCGCIHDRWWRALVTTHTDSQFLSRQ